jgi:hypothetical protein
MVNQRVLSKPSSHRARELDTVTPVHSFPGGSDLQDMIGKDLAAFFGGLDKNAARAIKEGCKPLCQKELGAQHERLQRL